jgi:Mg-chelatase subunit ChlD
VKTSPVLISVLSASALLACTPAGTSGPALAGAAGTTGSAGTGSPVGSAGTVGTAGTTGAAGTSGLAGTTGAGGGRTCGLQMFDLERKPAEILLLLDRSASMADPPDGATSSTPKWDLIIPAVKQVVTATDSSVSWGLKVFPEGTGSECVAGSVTSNIDVPIAAMNATNVNAGVTATVDSGNGTPTGDAVNAAAAYLQKLTDTNPKYILLATDGEPSCAGTTKSSDTARTFAVTAVTNAAAAGIHTFVVGVATTKDTATSVLNMLADAGKEPLNDPRPLANHFYLGTTYAQLLNALQVITGQVSSCVFPLNPPPPVLNDPMKLGVYFTDSMTKVPYDASMQDGWAYVDAADSAVQVYGSWCDKIKTAGANKVQIIYGCPSIDVP